MSTKLAEKIEKISFESSARGWVGGFFLLGVLVGLLGSLVVTWQYYIDADPRLIGLHFLGLNAGYVAGSVFAQPLLRRLPMRSTAMLGCAVAVGSLLSLSVLVPPVAAIWRIFALVFVGCSGGAIATSLLYALETAFTKSPAALVNRVGAWFGSGCFCSTVIVGVTYLAGSVRMETALLALAPAVFLFIFGASKFEPARRPAAAREEENRVSETLRGLRTVAVVLFSLLLFFQFGNEWAIAGWLPLFLIHRLGTSPVWAIAALAAYFLALLVGRLAARRLLRRISHRKLLLASALAAMAGYLLLSFTSSLLGAWAAVVVIGAAFGPIYPLLAETLDDRFSYHPGFYNGLFSIAITGAMMTPWLLGYVDSYLGVRYVMSIPALGSVAVLILALLIMLEARVMGGDGGDPLARKPALVSSD